MCYINKLHVINKRKKVYVVNKYLTNKQREQLGEYAEKCEKELAMLEFVGKLDDDDYELTSEEVSDAYTFFLALRKKEESHV